MTAPSLYQNLESLTLGGYLTFQSYANEALTQAYSAVGALKRFDFNPVPLTVDFRVVGGPGSFSAPTAPVLRLDELEAPERPADPTVHPVTLADPGVAPQEPTSSFVRYVKPSGQPGEFNVPAPGAAPTFEEVEFPDAPIYSLPDLPDFYQLDIPAPPDVFIPSFTAERPEVDFNLPSEDFAFTEIEYSSVLLDEVTARIRAALLGGTGLPAAIEQALYDRARSAEETNAQRALQEVSEEFVSRGWDEPNGILAKRLLQVRQNNQNQQNTLRRQIEIENKQIEVENLKHYVAQGIACEQMLIGAHLAKEERRFQSLRFAFEAARSIFDARVALFNAEVQAYQADAQVFRDRVQAAVAQADLYKTEMEGQAILGQINKTLAERYDTQVRGILTQVEVYRADVAGRTARVEAQRVAIEAYRSEVAAFGERVRAYQVEWEGYATRVRAEMGSVEAADIAARTYATRVSAWQTKANVSIERARTELGIEELGLRKFESDMRGFLGDLEAERSRVAAQAQIADAKSRLYQASAGVAQAASAASDRSFQLELEKGRTTADIALKNGEISLQASIQAAAQSLEALKAIAQTTTQLAASAMSAINISGSLSGQIGDSTSRSRSYGYSGEIDAPDQPDFS